MQPAPTRQATAFSGSRTNLPNNATRPEETLYMSCVKRLISSLVPSLLKVAMSIRSVRR